MPSRQVMTHVSVGNINVDVTLFVDALPGRDEAVVARDIEIGPGGAALNYAVAAALYGHVAYLVASASSHPMAREAIERARAMGVNTRYVKVVDDAPGVVVVLVTPDGDRRMVKFRGANEYLSVTDLPRHLVEEANIVHLASVPPLLAQSFAELVVKFGALVSYDPGGYALSDPDSTLKVARNANIVFLNKAEAARLGVARIADMLKLGVDIVVVKKGSGGALAITGDKKALRGFSRPIAKVVNATGAGDAFDAYFNAVYLESKSASKALLYAVAAGALKTSCRTSVACWDKGLFNKQLDRTYVEESGRLDEGKLEEELLGGRGPPA